MTEQTNNISNKPVRVRFAPSPTGKLHIGGARTAIYNWAFARATGGTFVLRIEDTDPERSTKENTELILRAMDWMGLTWDEGPQVGGPYGPYFQTQRMDTYKKALEVLKEKDAVYPCFCTKEELEAKRKLAEEKEGGYSGYDRTCRHLSRDEAAARIAAGEPHVWRLKVPLDHGPVEFNDAVYGPMSFPIDVMDDMVVVRTDGTPTYNFAVVCDDVNMQMTHIIRGDDHLSNTPRQILIYEALGAPLPTFAHLSMILGPDGKKLSKRHGATSVEEYRDRGYLPDALVNFLALLGWSLDGETTIISREELCSSFSLDRITKKDAIFDETKLNWMNGVYMRELSPEAWFDLSVPWLAKAVAEGERIAPGVTVLPTPEETFAETPAAPVADAIEKADEAVQESEQLNTTEAEDIFDTEMGAKSEDPFPEEVDVHSFESLATIEEDIRANADFYQRIYPLIIERLERLDQIPEKLAYLFWGPNIELDPKSVQKVLPKDGSRADEALKACRNVLADESIPWEAESLQEACRALCEPLELKPKLLFQPLRVAVCGNMVSPPLFESIELMQRSDVIDRIDSVISHFFA